MLLHWEFTHFLWCRFLWSSGVSWCMPVFVALMVEAWRLAPFIESGRVLWNLIPFAMVWSVQLERNARIYKRAFEAKEIVA